MSHEEYVLKRNGEKEAVSFDKILKRIKNMSYDDLNINFTTLTIKIIDRLYNDIKTISTLNGGNPRKWNFPLELLDKIIRRKVMSCPKYICGDLDIDIYSND